MASVGYDVYWQSGDLREKSDDGVATASERYGDVILSAANTVIIRSISAETALVEYSAANNKCDAVINAIGKNAFFDGR